MSRRPPWLGRWPSHGGRCHPVPDVMKSSRKQAHWERKAIEIKTATTIAQGLVRVTGLIQIILGALFWTGYALNLVPVHMLVGSVLVLSLWTLAFLAARAGVNRGFILLAAPWGILVPVLGMTQGRILPGDAHWLIQIVHLLVGLIAIGLGERLAARIKHARKPVLQP